jgi:hypothetical protein
MLDEYEEDIYGSGAYRRDMERWPDGSYSNPDKGLDTFRKYVFDRLEKLDEYYDRIENLLKYNNLYITRSGQYEDFLDAKFVFEINDRETLLYDDDYRDFIRYIGVDANKVSQNVRYVIVDGRSKTVEYYDDIDENGIQTCIGFIKAYDNAGNYEIYVDGKEWCSSSTETDKINSITFMTEEGIKSFDFTRKYTMWADLI